MKENYRELFEAKIVKSVGGLALIAKVIVEGYLSGLNKSRKIGYGMEFSQYRGYEPGDDLRLLDWKMLARSGRYYIKQSDIDSNIAVKFVLDASNSMRHEEDGLSKIDYARILIASLAYLAQKQGDAIGFFAYNEHSAHHLYPSLKKAHFDRFLHELLEVENSGIWKLDEVESANIHDRNHKELIFFITDLYEYHDELSNFIKSLKTPKNEVIVVQIIGNKELRFDYKGLIFFEDLETGTKVKVDTKSVKKEYIKEMTQKIESAKTFLFNCGVDFNLFKLEDNVEDVLYLFLKKRNKLI
ncbi:MAG: DUF58 domain-containing protein [Lutimonas sp.]